MTTSQQTTPEQTTPTTGGPEPTGSDAGRVLDGERANLLETLAHQRHFLRFTTRGLSDDQARQRTTASELTLGGLVKHVSATERNWAEFIVEGPSALGDFSAMTEEDFAQRADEFRLLPEETLAGVLAEYAEVARRTDELVATLEDLNVSHPLPSAPWFEEDKRWSARRVLLHIIGETSQHAGHADIIRESLDGALSMA
ncbi:DinB family protein [Streptomyces triticirhizae]|uniref:DinB family protein n=1 Tax=Streptomyces triticirhizae TaxID=2483353 RepID=A0A3M2LX56_9ACTN|nr:DinB family protein [Streptomyces triticirhizae]RMI41143.1 DinB family protein [Streptomyces triticirhizae]